MPLFVLDTFDSTSKNIVAEHLQFGVGRKKFSVGTAEKLSMVRNLEIRLHR